VFASDVFDELLLSRESLLASIADETPSAPFDVLS
jgi:hypothetical protein